MYPSIYNNSFPSPPLQYIYEDDQDFLLQQISIYGLLQHHQPPDQGGAAVVVGEATVNSNNDNKRPKSKKCSKKDRHSKIHTAHGPRDRRMRLSLDVARKFFDLQDTLGFDKASKTVDWLLVKSRTAIKELKENNNTSSNTTTSECSGVVDQELEPSIGMEGKPSMPPEKKTKAAGRVRAAFNPLAKESRNKARERARERTKLKSLIGGGHTTPTQPCLPEKASGPVTPPEDHSWYLSNIFPYHQNTPHQQQFADFSCSGKYWEGYNNGNL